MSKLSIIICTYNPDPGIFKQCLDHLEKAARFYNLHEIIIIDNHSAKPVEKEKYVNDFLSNTPYARVEIESKQGLTPARLRGIRESTGDILVFVDDDNFIDQYYFINGIEIAKRYLEIGSWSGQVKLIFEEPPPLWTKKYWGLLVYREFTGNFWSNLPHLPETMPCGAGLFVRKPVAEEYLHLHESGKRNIQLDRTATSLFSAGDNDLAACACDIGMGVGIFTSLVLNHYIPKERLNKQYLLKLAEGIAQSSVIFRSFRGEKPKEMTIKKRVAETLRVWIKSGIDRKFQQAVFRGEKNGRRIL